MCGRGPPIPPVVDLVDAEWTRPCHMRHLDHDVAMINGKLLEHHRHDVSSVVSKEREARWIALRTQLCDEA